MATQQKALYLDGVGKGFSLKSTEIYKPASGELLIKIISTALNPFDWKLEKFNFFPLDFPLIIGLDAAGEIVEVGEGVEGFVKGDRVLFAGVLKNREDTYQQYAVAPAFRVAKIPSGWSYDQAATIPTCLMTAWMGLYHNVPYGAGFTGPTEPNSKGKYSDTPIVILAGATCVGQFAIQLAKYSGFFPIITTASLKHEEYLKSLGATHVIDRAVPHSELPAEIAKITSKPINFVFDSISAPNTQQVGYDLISETGTVVIVTLPAVRKVDGSKKTVIQVQAFVSAPHNVDLVKAIYAQFNAFAEAGHILPNRPEVVPGGLNGIVDGLKRLENNQVSGVKLVVHPEDTA